MRRTIAGVAVLACLVVTAVLVTSRLEPDPVPLTAPVRAEPRQLQFETPGGTRIIWVLNPQLEL